LTKNRKKIAIVGMAFRFPGGVSDSGRFWQALKEGEDLVTEVPESRWAKSAYYHSKRAEPGKSYTWSAGVIPGIDEFDAGFFGISPREARQMDPQQRLLLELTWEALENGGQVPEQLAGSGCAVYVGIASSDYAHRRIDDLSSADAYTMTGNTASVASNRISYIFDLHGPSMSLDTACSSSLVALHQACKSIWEGEAPMAIAGGVNMLLHPFAFVGFSKASMLSPNGRCKSFDESGDGYVRSEGSAVLFLKPLDQAEADGDPIHAVITSSGVNCDGRTKGISMPSSDGQGALLRSIYQAGDVDPNRIAYFEAHGTGTAVGDPIETSAIGKIIGAERAEDNPLPIGSVKSNLGHLETASGMAGLVKVVHCLKNRAIPPSIHFNKPNPKIDFKGLNLKVVTEYTPVPEDDVPLLMGVNSFGFGGANAHVLLEEYSPSVHANKPCLGDGEFPPLLLSARSDDALKKLANAYLDQMSQADAPHYYDLAYTAAFRRQQLDQRLALFGRNKDELVELLEEVSQGDFPPGTARAEKLSGSAKVALVFSGNGSQWLGMGRQLMEREPLFKRAVEEVAALQKPYVDYSLVGEFLADQEESNMHLTEVAQPALFALQVGLMRILWSKGLKAEAAFGHSVGEITAAWAAGALSLEQAVRVICERSGAQSLTRGTGRMAAVGISAEKMKALLTELEFNDVVEVAAINSPTSVTLSGSLAALEELKDYFEDQGTFFKLLDLQYAFHSRFMDPIRERLIASLEGLSPVQGHMRYISTVTGSELDGSALGADYWWDNIRKPVRFGKAVETLIDDGVQIFLEIGPHPIMQGYLNDCLRESEIKGRAVPTLKRETDESASLLEAFYTTLLLGCPVDMDALFPAVGRYAQLPSYPWQRKRHWYPLTNEGYDLVNRKKEHPLLGYRLKPGEPLWESHLDPSSVEYLADHVVGGVAVMPAAGYVEMALAASKAWFDIPTYEVEDLEIRAPLLLDGEQSKSVHFTLNPEDGRFTIKSRVRLSDDPWTVNSAGRLAGEALGRQPEKIEISAAIPDGTAVILADEHYVLAQKIGLSYGPAFQGIAEVWPETMGAFARLETPQVISSGLDQHILHPAFLDACFQVLIGIFREELEEKARGALIPVRVGRLRFYGPAGKVSYFHARVTGKSPRSVAADFQLLDELGNTLAELQGCRFKAVVLSKEDACPKIYEYRALLKPRQNSVHAASMPLIDELIACAEKEIKEHEDTLRRRDHFQEALPLFDAMAAIFAYQTFKALGVGQGVFSVDSLIKKAGIARAYRPLLARLLSILEEDGLVRRDEGVWSLLDVGELPSVEDIWLTILGDHPAYLSELVLMGRCGSNLPALLKGEVQVADILTPPNGGGTLEHLYESAPSYAGVNAAASSMLQKIVDGWPKERRLRILEIEGEQGGLTAHLLPLLPSRQCDYLLAAASEGNLAQAEVAFSGYPFFRVDQVDLLADSANQAEIKPYSFDLIIAANSLHSQSNPNATLGVIKSLLVKGGLLLALERQTDRFTDITSGIEIDWWSQSQDAEHPVSRLLSPNEWASILQESGFEDAGLFTEPEAGMDVGAYLVAAKNPEASQLKAGLEVQGKTQTWVIMVDRDAPSWALGRELNAWLRAHSQNVVTVETGDDYQELAPDHYAVDPASPNHFVALLDAIKSQSLSCDHVIQLMGLSLNDSQQPFDLQEHQNRRCLSIVHLIQALGQVVLPSSPTVSLITAGAVTVPELTESRPSPSQAPLWGLGRVIMNEHPELDCRLIDLQMGQDLSGIADTLLTELTEPDLENEITLTDRSRYVLRMEPVSQLHEPGGSPEREMSGDVHLDFETPGPLKNLQWHSFRPGELAPDEIAIKPRAAGLNFRDVMYAMGLLPDEAVENGFSGPSLGMELAGEVIGVGSAVIDFQIGDPVVGFAPSCFSSHVITKASAAMPKPVHWTFEEAATIPTTFFTVYYAFHHLAQLQPGEKVLIHGAAGGVGIAAIQFARYRGAEIFATAGSDEKRDFVRLLGADHVMDSRSLLFADEIMEITGGEGVDIVLNSLAGEAVARNLSVLKPFGRFLELGKRDFYENNKIALRPFRNNISYFGIDADQLMVERSALSSQLFKEMMVLFEEGALRPLPHRVFPASRVADAFRYMQQSRQIGKVVVSFNGEMPAAQQQEARLPELNLSANAAYMVTGGLRGLGLKTASWLADKGAKILVLLGRSGMTDEAVEVIAGLEASDVKVHVKSVDVSDLAQMEIVFKEIKQELPPLAGIVHAAAVIDDSLIKDMNSEQMHKVFAPKLLGAWNLHQLSKDLLLEFFVLYSSATTYFGNPGQANYVAANSYLESLAGYRQSSGLPALALSLGPISDAGFLERNEAVKEALQSRMGGVSLSSDQALVMLEKLLASDRHGGAVVNFDWGAIQRFMPAASAPKFDELRRLLEESGGVEGAEDIHQLIAGLSVEEVQALVIDMLVSEVAQILRLPHDKLPQDRSVFDLGMDSLMGMELVMAIEGRFGIKLPVMALTEGPTIVRLAERIANLLRADEGEEGEVDQQHLDRVEAVASRHAESLSSEEIETVVEGLTAKDKGDIRLVQ